MADRRRGASGGFESRVVAVVGHALRTPVTTIRGLADVLHRTGEAPPELRAALHRESRILEELVDDLLVASDVSTVLPTDAPGEQQVGAIARRVWDQLVEDLADVRPDRPRLQDEDLVIASDGVVIAPQRTLRWIMRHLLDNAAKYGAAPVTIEVDEEGPGATGVVRVRTRDPASSASDVNHAFELFYRGEQAVTSAPGLGVGLTVARRLARHVGGDVQLGWDDEDLIAELHLPVP